MKTPSHYDSMFFFARRPGGPRYGGALFLSTLLLMFVVISVATVSAETVGFDEDRFQTGEIELEEVDGVNADAVSLEIVLDDDEHGPVLQIQAGESFGALAIPVVDRDRAIPLVGLEVLGTGDANERIELGDLVVPIADAWQTLQLSWSEGGTWSVFLDGLPFGDVALTESLTYRLIPGEGELRIDNLIWVERTLSWEGLSGVAPIEGAIPVGGGEVGGSGNSVVVAQPVAGAPILAAGPTGVYREVWLGIPGSGLSRLRASEDFPGEPSFSDVLPSFEAPTNWANTYGTRMRALLTAPSTGDYVFWIAGDDQSELWLGSSASESSKELIASVPGWSRSRVWDRFEEQQSAVIPLVAGRQYYIEALHKEGWGGDHLAVAWKRPSAVDREIISGVWLSPFRSGSSYAGNPDFVLSAGSDQIVYLPRNQFVLRGKAFDLNGGDDEVAVEWRSVGLHGADIHSVNSLESRVTVPRYGEYVFELRSDNGARAYSDTVTVTVYPELAADVGGVTRETWFGIRGSEVEALANDLRFPDYPDTVDQLPTFVGPIDYANQFGSRVRAYLHPPVSGYYRFWIAGNDSAEIRLSPTEDPSQVVTIAQTERATRLHQIDKSLDQESGPQRLEAGQRYYIEVMFKDNWSSDHFSVFWHGPLQARPQLLGGEFVAPYRSHAPFDPNATLVAIAGKDRVLHSPRRDLRLQGGYRYLIDQDREPSVEWSGPVGVEFENSASLSSLVTFPSEGVYELQLALDDGFERVIDSLVVEIQGALAVDVGGISREVWLEVPGRSVEDFVASGALSRPASITDVLPNFEVPTTWADDYGTRLRGYLISPASGRFDFWIASDDYSELWLSSDDDPTNARLVASLTQWVRQEDWDRKPTQNVAGVELVAGERYYIEALFKESRGADYFAAAWRGPGVPDREIIAGSYLVPFFPAPSHQGELEILIEGDEFTYWPNDSIDLEATVFDLDEGPDEVSVEWESVSFGSGVAFSDPLSLTTRVIFPGPGEYVLRLTARDGLHERSKEKTVVVRSPIATDLGGVTRHVWFGIGSSRLDRLTDHEDFPDRPFLRDVLPSLETPVDWSDSYGTRLQGYLQVPESGEFTFWLSGDDQSELYLSSDDSPLNRQRIAWVDGWTKVHQWNRYPEQESLPQLLVAGQRYYIEVLSKEGGGGDHVEVSWQGPQVPRRQIIHRGFLSPFEDVSPLALQQSLYVNAGLDQRHFLPRTSFTLSGAYRYRVPDEARAPTFEWRLVSPSGPGGVLIENPGDLETPVTIYAPGKHVFELTGRDGVDVHSTRVTIDLHPPLSPETGSILREVWLGVNGKMVENLLESERYLGNPSIRDQIPQFEVPANWANNYGGRYRGYLHVPEDGDYNFFISSDDYSELSLSSSSSTSDAIRIAFVDSWNRQRDWFRKPYQSSGPVRLLAGEKYYLEAWHKEAGGSDHFAVGWTGPGWSDPEVIHGSYLSPYAPAARFDNQIQLLTAASFELMWPDSQLPLQGLAYDLRKGPRSLEYYWRVLNGGSVRFSDPASQLTTAVFGSPGTYTIRFGAGDGVNEAYRDIRVSIAPPSGTGQSGLLREVWMNIRGVQVSDLQNHSLYPDEPTFSDIVTSFETPRDWADDYGTRLRGYLYPPESGTYFLWLSGDDYSELYFGEDGTDASPERMAWVEGWTTYQQWDKYPTQRTRALELTAGKKYYVEVLQKERGGLDHVAVGWTRRETGEPVIIPGGYLEPYGPASPIANDLFVVAGSDVQMQWPELSLELDGLVHDLKPGPYRVEAKWTSVGGGDVILARDNASVATAIFPRPGNYRLRLTANDGLNVSSDDIQVEVEPPASARSGRIVREVFEGIPGSRVRYLQAAAQFPNGPDLRQLITSLQVPRGWGNEYGTRIRGFVHPPVDGEYQFWVAGDDETQLWLSDNESPEFARLIAHVPSWSQEEEWEKFPEQTSPTISLVGGRKYFVEILHKEGGGGDHLAAAWTGPSIGERQIIAGRYLSPYSSSADTIPPVVTLFGERSMQLLVGEPFSEPGYLALDAEDGELTKWVDVIGEVDPSRPGIYQMAYYVYDSAGNRSGVVRRRVEVKRPEGSGTNATWPPPSAPGFNPPPPSGWTLPGVVSEQDAARLLMQATFGPSIDEIRRVQSVGIESWIDEQISLPPSLHVPHLQEAMALLGDGFENFGQDVEGAPSMTPRTARVDDRMYTWWTHAIEAPDQLRQRIAFALSEILVVSDRSPALKKYPVAVANYYDIMVRNAFGNYRDIMEEVSLSPVMGIYLTLVRNSRADPELGLNPDENYARELLQLFTIGLKWLYPDGTDQTDGQGNPIPTYGMDEILNFARVFTGWTFSGSTDFFWARSSQIDMLSPMMAFEEYHDVEPKTLLGGVVLPANQTAYDDLSDALDNIFHHPNMGPFLARGLIQRLVTSNPSPAYIYRVTQAFNDNGSGVRGDMAAVVKAILVDEEARDVFRTLDPRFGKQREPIIRLTHLIRAFYEFQVDSPPTLGRFGFGSSVVGALGQAPVYAPSVFNFFDKDYSPSGVLQDAGLRAPEFQITSEVRAIDEANFMHLGIDRGFSSGSGSTERISLNLAVALAGGAGIESILYYLELVLMGGTMPPEMKETLRGTFTDLGEDPIYRAESAIQLIVTSPQFIIQR